MNQFLELQRNVTMGYLPAAGAHRTAAPDPVVAPAGARNRASNGTGLPSLPPPELSRFPLLGSVVSWTDGQELVTLRRMDIAEDVHLRDHTFGGQVSVTDESLIALPVVPLTISMEMLAEAAVALCPGQVVVGMRSVRVHQWIALDDGQATLRPTARRKPGGNEVGVELERLNEDPVSGRQTWVRVMEAIVCLADAYPPAPAADTPFPLRAGRPYQLITGDLYAERMFHGPRLQGVVSLDRWGEDGTEATMEALPTTELFASTPDVALVTDPALLDAAGQLVGFWAVEHLTRGFNVFPFAAEDVRLYGPPPASGTRLTGRVRIRQLTELQMRSDIDVVGPDGHLLIQVTGWANRRFDVPPPLDRVWTSPLDAVLGAPWSAMMQALGRPVGVDCRLIDYLRADLLESGGRIWQRSLVHLGLTRRERAAWNALPGSGHAPLEWLCGRCAAKEAVRGSCGTESTWSCTRPTSRSSRTPTTGSRPRGHGAHHEPAPVVSLSCCGDAAVAIAADSTRCAGVGIHLGRVDHLEDAVALDPRERALVAALEVAGQQEWVQRLWCAKQAAGKALGRGAQDRSDLVAAAVSGGVVRFAVGPSGAPTAPTSDAEPLAVHTIRDGEWVAAVAIRWKN